MSELIQLKTEYVVIYGKPATGKTENKENLANLFGSDGIIDGFSLSTTDEDYWLTMETEFNKILLITNEENNFPLALGGMYRHELQGQNLIAKLGRLLVPVTFYEFEYLKQQFPNKFN